jgi:hypothetical protein
MSFLPKNCLSTWHLIVNLEHSTQCVTEQPSQKNIKTAKYTDTEALFVEQFLQKQAVTLLFVLRKISVVLCP